MIEVDGRPLSEAGLDGLEYEDADGNRHPIRGLAILQGETLREALERTLPTGWKVITKR